MNEELSLDPPYENSEIAKRVLESELCLPAQKVESIMR